MIVDRIQEYAFAAGNLGWRYSLIYLENGRILYGLESVLKMLVFSMGVTGFEPVTSCV